MNKLFLNIYIIKKNYKKGEKENKSHQLNLNETRIHYGNYIL